MSSFVVVSFAAFVESFVVSFTPIFAFAFASFVVAFSFSFAFVVSSFPPYVVNIRLVVVQDECSDLDVVRDLSSSQLEVLLQCSFGFVE